MSLQLILNEDWSDYDNKKLKGGSDRRNFACTETWEVDYLIKKIKKHYPAVPETYIRDAIKLCCIQLSPPHPREVFVECVARRLGIRTI